MKHGNGAATLVKIVIAFAVFATGYYFPLFRPASSQPPSVPATAEPVKASAPVP